jgi:hypothetical protein
MRSEGNALRHGTHKRGQIGALLAALLLVFQSLGVAAAAGAGPHPSLDAYGNPLCAHSDQDRGGTDRATLPDCCTLACGMQLPALGTPDLSHPGPRLDAALSGGRASLSPGVPSRAPDHGLAGPRAPPSL